MKENGYYDLLVKLSELSEDENKQFSNIKEELTKIKNIDLYLAYQFMNNFLLSKLKTNKTVISKIEFLNNLINNYEAEFSDKLLLAVNKEETYDNRIRLTDNHLFTNQNEQELVLELNKEIRTADEICLIYPFISKALLNKIEESIAYATKNNVQIRIITTTFDNTAKYLNLIELEKLIQKYKNISIRIEDNLEKRSERIHIKASIFKRVNGFGTAILGSSNLTQAGMMHGREWNVKINEFVNNDLYTNIINEFTKLWNDNLVNFNDKSTRELLIERIKEYEQSRIEKQYPKTTEFLTIKKYLYDYQKEIIKKLEYRRKINKTKHLVIMATGTGKTVVSAFDYQKQIKENNNARPKMLFLAHQKEIIDQAIKTFRSVLQDNNFGSVFYERVIPSQKDYLFATIQSVYSRLQQFSPDQYDVIFFDEAHHIAANSFDKVFKYFKAKQVIGLTATPERLDGKSIVSYFDNEYAYELRLYDAINQKLLSSFDYYCIDDISDLTGVDLNNDSQLFKKLNTTSRNNLLYNMIDRYIGFYSHPKCIIFCINTAHAKIVAEFLQSKNLKADYLTSEVRDKRDQVIDCFKRGRINYLCVVNMFNEGIDIPEVDTIIMLRPTASQTIYLQQIGRGLRKHEYKNKLEIYDLIANVDQKYDITVGIKNLFHYELSAPKLLSMSEGLPYGCTITLEKRSKEIILNNIKSWIEDRNRIKSHVVEYFKKYNAEGLSVLLKDYDISLIEFYNRFNDFYFRVGQNINKYKPRENDTNRNKNILKQFLFLNSYDIINYFIKRLQNKLTADEFKPEFDNLLLASLFYEVTSIEWFYNVIPNLNSIKDPIAYFVEHHKIICQELLMILNYKLNNETLIFSDKDDLDNLLIPKATFTVKQALCLINRINFLPSRELKIIAFQAGYLTFDNNTKLVILADIDPKNYGKLTSYDPQNNDYCWSIPERMNANCKLVNDIKDKNIKKYLFIQNKINENLENLKLKLYDFVGIGEFVELLDNKIITARFKIHNLD